MALKNFRYPFLLKKIECPEECDDVRINESFVKLIMYLSRELCFFTQSEAKVSDFKTMSEFYDKLAEFLDEYGCVYPSLCEGSNEDRFDSPENREYLIKYLATEIVVAKKLASKAPHMLSRSGEVQNKLQNNFNEDSIIQNDLTTYLRKACLTLNMSRPPKDISTEKLLDCIRAKVEKVLESVPKTYLGKPLLPKEGLNEKQWATVQRLIAVLQQEFTSRRGTLLKRLDVTVQSFKWSDKAKSKLEAIAAVYAPLRQAMNDAVLPGLPHLLAAKDSLLRIEKTSGASRRRYTACELNRILIGRVPDRGGRAWELEPPPPEVSSFQSRKPDSRSNNNNRGNFNQKQQGARGGRRDQDPNSYHNGGGAMYEQYKGDGHTGGLVFRNDPVNPNNFNFTYQQPNAQAMGMGYGAQPQMQAHNGFAFDQQQNGGYQQQGNYRGGGRGRGRGNAAQ